MAVTSKEINQVNTLVATHITIQNTGIGWRLLFGQAFGPNGEDICHHTAVLIPTPIVPEVIKLVNDVAAQHPPNPTKQ